jgi:signal peptidase I
MSFEDAESEGRITDRAESVHDLRAKRRRSLIGTVVETLLIVGAAFAIAMLVQTFMFRITGILQTSMLPTIDPGDRIIVNCLSYRFGDPAPGQIVVIHDPLDGKKDIIKRVIALGGDTIELVDGVLQINGAVVDEPYVANRDVIKGQARFTVPAGYIYVMGDNRPVSGDSRDFGPVAENEIIGKVVCVMWPFGHWKSF